MKKIALSLLCVFIIACRNDISVVFPFEGERLFIFGELTSEQPIQVRVDKTYPPNGTILFTYGFLDSTEVAVYEDGVFLENLTQQRSNRHFFNSTKGNKARVGHTYQVRVVAPNMPEASSLEEVLLQSAIVDSVWVADEQVISPLNPSIPAKLICVSVSSIPFNVPYLFIELIAYKDNREIGPNIISTEQYSELENPCVPYTKLKYLFKTDCYNRTNYVFKFIMESEGSYQDGSYDPSVGRPKVNKLITQVSSINQSYYDFYKNSNEPLNFFSVLEGVKPTTSGITNGYGAVLTKNTVSKAIKIDAE